MSVPPSLWKLGLVVSVGLLSGALVILAWQILISNWSRAFNVVAVFFLCVVYSNALAKIYTHFRVGMIQASRKYV